MKAIIRIVICVICLAMGHASASAQMCPSFPCTIESFQTGEEASASIDNFLAHAAVGAERVFVIARSGKNDRRLNVNLYRLCAARTYFNFRIGLRDSSGEVLFNAQPVVFAEGGFVDGEGRIEFYVGSKLALTRLIKADRSANLDCCNDWTPREVRLFEKACRDWKAKPRPRRRK